MFSQLFLRVCCVLFFKQKTAYEMRISDWSSDVCSSDPPGNRRKSPPLQGEGWVGMGFPSAASRPSADKTHPHPGLPLEGEGEGQMTTIALPATRDHKDASNDRLFRYVLVATVVFVLLALAGAALSMLWGGRHALEASGLDFFFTADWNPVENRYGALVPIYGTIVTAMIAMVIAIPVSFGIAFFLDRKSTRLNSSP